MAHRRAKLTPFGRLLLVERVAEGWSVARVAESMGVSRGTAYKWVARYREEGSAGLEDRSSAPRHRPHALRPEQVRRILKARRRLETGPHRLEPVLGHPRSTIYGVLRRHGLSRLDAADRPTRVSLRYERERPGELVHVDVKKLGRIPPGGGHRVHGRGYRPTIADWVDAPGLRYELLDGDAEVAPGVRLLPTPGHSPGHQSLLIETSEGTVVVAGQSLLTRAEWEGAADAEHSGEPVDECSRALSGAGYGLDRANSMASSTSAWASSHISGITSDSLVRSDPSLARPPPPPPPARLGLCLYGGCPRMGSRGLILIRQIAVIPQV